MIWIPAKNYRSVWRKTVDLAVIHCTETPRRKGGARAVAKYFATTTKSVSAHYILDDYDTVQCVSERNIAWAAPGANGQGIQIELVGYAKQTSEQWLTGATLDRAAELVAQICKRWSIPVELLNSADLLNGKRGITSHASVSQAWKKSTHWDPGHGFPWTEFLKRVPDLM